MFGFITIEGYGDRWSAVLNYIFYVRAIFNSLQKI